MKKRTHMLWLPVAIVAVMLLTGCSHRNYSTTKTQPLPEARTVPMPEATGPRWCFPLANAKVISNYGPRNGRQHTGIDLKTKNKDKIRAAFDGVVVWSKKFSSYGKLIRIQHDNGLETYYAHNSKNLVNKGDYVKAGQVIALTGQTGRATTPHLHLETRVNGKPRNPNNYFDFFTHTLRAGSVK